MAPDPNRNDGRYETPNRASKTGALWIGVAILVAVVVAFFAFSGFEGGGENEAESEPAVETTEN